MKTAQASNRVSIPFWISRDESLAAAMMDDCMIVGISGGCGSDCPVFQRGECEEPEGIEDTEGLYSSDVDAKLEELP